MGCGKREFIWSFEIVKMFVPSLGISRVGRDVVHAGRLRVFAFEKSVNVPSVPGFPPGFPRCGRRLKDWRRSVLLLLVRGEAVHTPRE